MSRHVELEGEGARFPVKLVEADGCLRTDCAGVTSEWRIVHEEPGELVLEAAGRRERLRWYRDGAEIWIVSGEGVFRLRRALPEPPREGAGADGNAAVLESPLTGRVVKVECSAGDRIAEGAVVLVVEAMKMEHPLRAPFPALVQSIECAAGDTVDMGKPLARLVRAEPE